MAFNINTFKQEGLKQGGARPSLFEVQLTLPGGIRAAGAGSGSWLQGITSGSDSQFSFLCRAAQLPAATIGSIDVAYFGRMIKLAGDRTFTDWTVTILNDEDFLIRSLFEKWSNAMNKFEANARQNTPNGETDYKSVMTVTQFSKSGSRIRAYDIIGAFPTAVDAIDLNWETQNQIETFGVTFAYDYWLPKAGTELNNSYNNEATSPVSL